MFCRKCGNQILDDSIFCPMCGNAISDIGSNDYEYKTGLLSITRISSKLEKNTKTEIIIDGTCCGYLSCGEGNSYELDEGPHILIIRQPGYRLYEKEITISALYPLHFQFEIGVSGPTLLDNNSLTKQSGTTYNRKKNKRNHGAITAIIIILVAMFLIKSLSGQTKSTVKKSESSNTSTISTQEGGLPSISEMILCDNEIAKITVAGFEKNTLFDTYVVGINIVNNSEKTIHYYIESVIVNGFTFDALSFGDIYAGMNADADLGISIDEVTISQIDPIIDINFSIIISYSDTDETLLTVPANIQTSAQGQTPSQISFVGTEVYNCDGVTVYMRPTDVPTVGCPVLVYVVNDSDRNIKLCYNDVAFDNKMTLEMMSGPFVIAHTKRIAEMNLSYFVDDPDISSFETMTLKLSILPYRADGSFSTGDIIETEQFTLTFD